MSEVVIPESVEPIIAWVRGMKPTAVVGQCQEPSACVIAEYLTEQHPDYYFFVLPQTGGGTVTSVTKEAFDTHHSEPHYAEHRLAAKYGTMEPLPPALNRLALKFDDMVDLRRLDEGGEASMVTAGEFLEKWEAQ
jgi:hypothetical protein